jgi:hypothetical protein
MPAKYRDEVTIDYVPGRSERIAGMFFKASPSYGKPQLRGVGHQNPWPARSRASKPAMKGILC